MKEFDTVSTVKIDLRCFAVDLEGAQDINRALLKNLLDYLETCPYVVGTNVVSENTKPIKNEL